MSIAFNVDSVLAEPRGCIDALDWLGPISKGNVGLRRTVVLRCMESHDAPYVASVQSFLAS
jgi:hypothetical protein